MGPKLKARLAQLKSLSVAELATLRGDLVAAFDVLDDSGGSMDDLNEIAAAVDSVDAETAERNERAGLRDRMHLSDETAEADADEDSMPTAEQPGDEEATEDGDSDEDPDADEADDADTDEADADVEDEATPVAASARPSLDRVAAASDKRRAPKVSNPLRVTTHLVAAGDVGDFSAGQEIMDSMSLSKVYARKLRSLGRGGTGDRVLVASILKEFPEERVLGEDPFLNDQKMDAVMAKAVTASGGICEPLAVDYAIDTIGSTARPLQAGLPSYNASRGGVKFTVPPSLADVVGVPETWTIADDEAAAVDGGPEKACFRIECVDPEDAFVYGVPVCLEVGNMMGRFTPEIVNAQQALLDVATARMAELALLDAIDTTSTAVTSTGVLGTVRTTLPTLDLISAGYRYRHRLDSSTVRIVLPAWVKEECRADLAMELAHDNPPFNVSDAQLNAYFSSRNYSPIWMLEDKAGAFGAAQGAGAIHPWPATFVAYVFAEGTYQYLDGGRIDLGVVRDSTLNKTNDYQIWREDFEGVAKRGNESLKVTVTTKPTGMSAGTKDTSV